jgi:hypothetical protein
MLIVYLFSFIVLQYRVERFIYRRVKKSMMMFRFGIKHIHKSAHYDWYGNIDQGSERSLQLTKNWKSNVASAEEYRRISWKCIAWIENSIIYGARIYIHFVGRAMDDKVIRKILKACW